MTRRAQRVLIALLAGAYLWLGGAGAMMGTLSRIAPQPRGASDFFQFWSSGQAWWHGGPAYPDLRATLDARRPHLGNVSAIEAANVLPANGYPPFSTALLLPLTLPTYSFALDLWLWLSAISITLSAVVVVRCTLSHLHAVHQVAAVVALAVVLFSSAAAYVEFRSGNTGGLLAFMTTLSFLLWKEGRPRSAATAAAVPAAFKLFPGLLLIWFVSLGRTRAYWFVAAGAVFTCMPVLIFGPTAFRDFFGSLSASEVWYGYHYNLSVWGWSYRAFMPTTDWLPIQPIADAAWMARPVAIAASVVILGVLILAVRRSNGRAPGMAYVATIAAMLLVSPISWPSMLFMLTLPIALLLRRWRGSPVMVVVLAGMAAALWILPGMMEWRFKTETEPYTVMTSLTLLGFKTYTMIGIFGLAAWTAAHDGVSAE